MIIYAQTAYNQRLGTGSDTIHWAGCFLTAFCNLMGRFGVTVDPPTLNLKLINAGQFSGSNIKGWGAITKVYRTVVVKATGIGWPKTNNAIVEFRYIQNGQNMTHFSLMQDWTQQTILDSWDGVVRHSGFYGVPAQWASYVKAGVVARVIAAVKPKPAAAPVVAQVKKPVVPPQKFYTVVSGDTMSKIAIKFKLSLSNLAHLNPSIKNLNVIKVGQKVRVQ